MIALACLMAGVLAVLAGELANTQTQDKQVISSRIQDNAVLVGALLDGLFQTVIQQKPQDSLLYGGARVSPKVLRTQQQANLYLAVLDNRQRVLAHTSGFNAQARDDLPLSAALALVRTGHPYGLGNLLPYGHTGVINLAVPFATAHGRRTLLSGLNPRTLAPFLLAELKEVHGVRNALNLVIDGNLTVLASTSPRRAVGYRFTAPVQVQALTHKAGEYNDQYYAQSHLKNATWRVVLSAPSSVLFASVSGWHLVVPWVLLVGFGLTGLLAFAQQPQLLRTTTELRLANQKLQAAVEDLATFASIAAHDLRAPLRHISIYANLLCERFDREKMNGEMVEFAKRIEQRASDLNQLISDLLNYARSGTPEYEKSVALESVLRDAIGRLGEDEHQYIRVEGHFPAVLQGDPTMLEELFSNLITNALKFHSPDRPPEVIIKSHPSETNVVIEVADRGIGIDPEYRERIFQPFQRLHTTKEFPGTGIGLAVSRRIARQGGGDLSVSANPGGGSIFTVTLPKGELP